MSKWVSLAKDLVNAVRANGSAALLIDETSEEEGSFIADTQILDAGEGSLSEERVRKFLWDFRGELKDCTTIYAKEAEGRWLLCGGAHG